jgi:polysaccharide export outer membrane protein
MKVARALCALPGLFALAFVLTLTIGCKSPRTEIPSSLTGARAPGILATGDQLRFSFPGDTQLNQAQRIRPDGYVSLPAIGEVKAAGRRLGEFQRDLQERYQSHLANNDVVVTLETGASFVSVTGAVNKPGDVSLDRSLTLFEAIQKSGGFQTSRMITK